MESKKNKLLSASSKALLAVTIALSSQVSASERGTSESEARPPKQDRGQVDRGNRGGGGGSGGGGSSTRPPRQEPPSQTRPPSREPRREPPSQTRPPREPRDPGARPPRREPPTNVTPPSREPRPEPPPQTRPPKDPRDPGAKPPRREPPTNVTPPSRDPRPEPPPQTRPPRDPRDPGRAQPPHRTLPPRGVKRPPLHRNDKPGRWVSDERRRTDRARDHRRNFNNHDRAYKDRYARDLRARRIADARNRRFWNASDRLRWERSWRNYYDREIVWRNYWRSLHRIIVRDIIWDIRDHRRWEHRRSRWYSGGYVLRPVYPIFPNDPIIFPIPMPIDNDYWLYDDVMKVAYNLEYASIELYRMAEVELDEYVPSDQLLLSALYDVIESAQIYNERVRENYGDFDDSLYELFHLELMVDEVKKLTESRSDLSPELLANFRVIEYYVQDLLWNYRVQAQN